MAQRFVHFKMRLSKKIFKPVDKPRRLGYFRLDESRSTLPAAALRRSDRMTEPAPFLYSGRSFSSQELALMRQAATDYASLGITEIARTICEWLDWKRPNGRLKNHECRLLLERLDHQGILKLPPLRRSGCRGPRTVAVDAPCGDPTPILTSLPDLEPLNVALVEKSESTLWRQLMERFHYLGCRTPVGPVTFCPTSLTA